MNQRFKRSLRCSPSALALALVLGVLGVGASGGCGQPGPPMVPVSGIVAFPDGTPLDHGILQLRHVDRPLLAKGEIDAQGRFRLSTRTPGDGVEPGKYRGAIVQLILTEELSFEQHHHAKRLDPKYANFDAADLSFEFTLEGPREIRITVSEPPSH